MFCYKLRKHVLNNGGGGLGGAKNEGREPRKKEIRDFRGIIGEFWGFYGNFLGIFGKCRDFLGIIEGFYGDFR